ncbi:MAG: ureidoglycolate lyase [Xenococcaceae cyanobacterium MO_167.B27]|nr:ureidoglycolate lyase [Xenococcaceae cyanobacterium MO_167.B27]
MSNTFTVKQLRAELITPEKFKPYGQLITPSFDGKPYDDTDAQLQLSGGIPRFYIMQLSHRGREFTKITRHNLCTQCLGSLEGKDWYIAVAPTNSESQPDISKMAAFHIPGDCFIKLEVGTWHAGPYFDHETTDFYNLELSDTNVIDHFTHNFLTQQQLKFEIVD